MGQFIEQVKENNIWQSERHKQEEEKLKLKHEKRRKQQEKEVINRFKTNINAILFFEFKESFEKYGKNAYFLYNFPEKVNFLVKQTMDSALNDFRNKIAIDFIHSQYVELEIFAIETYYKLLKRFKTRYNEIEEMEEIEEAVEDIEIVESIKIPFWKKALAFTLGWIGAGSLTKYL